MLSMDSSDLDLIFVGNGLMEVWVLHELWKVDVNGGSESSSNVGWASRDITEMVIVGELGFGFNETRGLRESSENGSNIRSHLHGDDSKLILLVNPDKECLGVVVEDSSAGWPVSVEVASFQESVSLPIFEQNS
jgi:hypothetical protein